MLVLSRRAEERIQIGEEITVTVVRIADGVVRLGIEAPSHVTVMRQEIQLPVNGATADRNSGNSRNP